MLLRRGWLLFSAVLPFAAHFASGQADSPPQFVGRWQMIGPLWEGTLEITPDKVSWDNPECKNLPYTTIRTLSLPSLGKSFAIEVDAPADHCRHYKQKEVLLYFAMPDPDTLFVHWCPSAEDLELLLADKNHYCSGRFIGKRQHPRG